MAFKGPFQCKAVCDSVLSSKYITAGMTQLQQSSCFSKQTAVFSTLSHPCFRENSSLSCCSQPQPSWSASVREDPFLSLLWVLKMSFVESMFLLATSHIRHLTCKDFHMNFPVENPLRTPAFTSRFWLNNDLKLLVRNWRQPIWPNRRNSSCYAQCNKSIKYVGYHIVLKGVHEGKMV